MKLYHAACAAFAVLAAPALAQSTETMVVGGQPAQVLHAGTPITLRTNTELTTKGKHLKVGDRFALEVADAVSLNGRVVIPVGSPAVGEVTSVRNKGMWGKSGNIETRLISLTANGRTMRITGSVGDKGVKAGGGAIATSAIVFLPAGFFMTGTSAVIPPGTSVPALLAEDIPLVFAPESAPAPMTIASEAPVTVAPAVATAPALPAGGAVVQAVATVPAEAAHP